MAESMQLTVLGSSPAAQNAGDASSGYLLATRASSILVECGHGVLGVLQRVARLSDLSAAIISHMHPDHFFDLVPLRYALEHLDLPPIPLFLPPGGQGTLRRLQSALDLPDSFFTDFFQTREYDPSKPLQLADDLVTTFAATHHFIPGYALRVGHDNGQGPRLVFSGDTSPTDSVRALLRNASFALVEATLDDATKDGHEGHLTAREAGSMGREARVDRLVLTHYWDQNAGQIKREAEEGFGREVDLARSGDMYQIESS